MSFSSQQDDSILFEAISQGDENAFRFIFDRYKKYIYSAAIKWTKSSSAAEDITQEVFIKLWNCRQLLAQVTNPKAYIYKIAFNKTKNHFRNNELRVRFISNLPKASMFMNNVMEEINAKESEQLINSAISQLSEQKQTIYMLKKMDNKSYKEIAESLKISPETVRSHLYETMKHIRLYLKNAMLILPLLIGCMK